MPPPNSFQACGKAILAILLVTIFAMILVAWGTRTLSPYSADTSLNQFASQLLILPLSTAALWLIVRDQKIFLSKLFTRAGLTPKLIVTAFAIGAMIRTIWWALITARASFGLLPQSLEVPPAALTLSYRCPELLLLTLAILNWWLVVPVFEEFVHRGLLLSYFVPKGPVSAVLISAIIFALFHPPNAMVLAFFFGIVIGVLFWNVKSLWPPIIAHATYDGLQVFDWMCMRISWNPDPAAIPLLVPGTFASLVVIFGSAAIIFLVSNRWVGPQYFAQPSDRS